MSKCSCCGEEVGSAKVCPICGSTVVAKAPQTQTTVTGGSGNILQEIEKAKIKMIEDCGKSVTKIWVRNSDGAASGTGWRGHNDYIITNAHVVEGDNEDTYSRNVECEFSDKLKLGSRQRIKMNVVYYSRVEDIAILKPQSGTIPSEVPTLKITDVPTKQGEMVFTICNPLHYKFTYTEGAVANPDYKRSGSKAKFDSLQTTLTLNSGNSGGPVFNAKGEIVGMATYSELQAQVDQVIDPLAILNGGDLLTEKTSYTEIMGYGFCVKSEAILAAIRSI